MKWWDNNIWLERESRFAASLINNFAETELSLAHRTNPSYSFLWMDALMIPVYSGWCLQFLTQSTVLAMRHPVSAEQENSANEEGDVLASGSTSSKSSIDLAYWQCVSESATLFYHLCFCDQFVKALVAHPQVDHLMQVMDTVLRVMWFIIPGNLLLYSLCNRFPQINKLTLNMWNTIYSAC